ncbi:MFS transporter [Paenibacillus sp. GCM10027627]|uniref:MFS transporter n=1 Tax=unclassified Paenibacillus TaxID=185978 RepID=UPI00363D010B
MSTPASQNSQKLLIVLAITLIFSVMNGTMFNVVLPEIGKEFQLVPSEVSWIMTSYMVVYAIGSVFFGKLADKYKLKDLLTYGLLVFALGSAIGLWSAEYWMVILGRVLQAAGASVLPATAMIIPIRYFPPERRGRALGTSAIGLALGGALGPVVAGAVTSFGSWRLLFLISLLPLLTLPFFRRYLDDSKGQAGKIDYIGGALLASVVALLLLGITLTRPLLFAIGAVLLVLFIVRIRKAAHPFIDPALFSNRGFTIGLLIAFATTAMNFGTMYMTPQFLNQLNGLSPGSIGFVLFPAAIAAALLGRSGGKLADLKGNFSLVRIASALMLLAFALLSTFAGVQPMVIALLLVLASVGQTFMSVAMSNTISRTLTKEQTGVGMGMFSMTNFIAGAVSMGLIGKLLDQGESAFHLNPFVTNPSVYMYSNIFFVLAILIAASAAIYWLQFGDTAGSAAKSGDRKPQKA